MTVSASEKISLSFSFPEIADTFLRGDRALILVRDPEGKYILGAKSSYPAGIVRILGGGINPEEDAGVAACRELKEELGIQRDNLTELANITIVIDSPKVRASFHNYIFFTQLAPGEDIHPGDDVDAVMHLTKIELSDLIKRFYTLQDVPGFRWSDYGRLYGKIHEIALHLVQ